MVSVVKLLCSGVERINLGRLPSEKESKLASPQPFLHVDNEMHLPVKGTQRRWAYCNIKELQVRSSILYKR